MKKIGKIEIQLKGMDAIELNDSQMKNITGGSAHSGACSSSQCSGDCTRTINSLIYSGRCDWVDDSGSWTCGCKIY